MSALGQKRTFRRVPLMSALPPKADIGQRLCNLGAASFDPCAGSRETSNKIIQKGLASARRQSGTVSSSECWLRFRDPAPPASSPRWGFGGGGDSRRTTEGDPDAQDKVQVQNRITPKRQQDQDP
jgi:hypothetical protein